jgi:hypothetical protein
MSHLMDYGPDWPPAPEAAKAEHQPMTLRQRCGVAVAAYALIWAVFALVLHARGDAGTRLDFPAPPAQGHTTDVTTTLPPSMGR